MNPKPPDRNDLSTRIAWLREQLDGAVEPYKRMPLLDELSFHLSLVNAKEGQPYAVEEYRLAVAVRDRHWIMRSFLRRADCVYAQAHYSLALRYFRKAWKLLEDLPEDLADKAYISRNLGTIYYTIGKSRAAVKMLELSLRYARQSDYRSEIAATLSLFSRVCMNVGEYGRAWKLSREALEIHEARGFLRGVAMSRSEAGNIYALLRDWKNALESYRSAVALHRRLGNKYGEAYTYMGMGEAYVAQGRFVSALQVYRKALALTEETGDRYLHAEVWKEIGHSYTQQGRYGQALEALKNAEEEFRTINSDTGRSLVLLEFGEVLVAQREWGRAIEALLESQSLLSTWGVRSRETHLHRLLAQAYEAEGDMPKSLEHYKLFIEFEKELLNNEVRHEILAYKFRRDIETEKERYRAETDRLEEEAANHVRELTSLSLRIARNDELLEQLRGRLVNFKHTNGHTVDSINEIIREIDNRTGRVDAWNAFERQLQTLDHDFLHHLTERYPSLTPAEMRICSLLRINMSNKEIGALLNISDRTVDTHRTSIRRKLGLQKTEGLVGFLSRV